MFDDTLTLEEFGKEEAHWGLEQNGELGGLTQGLEERMKYFKTSSLAGCGGARL